jgi:carbonic anhydrase/acetyltransferase-like protein (isoleucine patch superfamily)
MALKPFAGILPRIALTAFVDDSAVVIGDVELGENSSVWPTAVIRGDVGPVRIGRETNIQDGCILHGTPAGPTSAEGNFVTVGDRVTIGHGVILHGCTIGDHCLIGMRAVVLDGAVVPAGTVVGANSQVPAGMKLEAGHVWAGAPVRRLRPLTEHELTLLEESASHYVALKDRHRAPQTER